jgi:hypothetical protein
MEQTQRRLAEASRYNKILPLGELESLARLLLTVFLPLNHPGITRQKAGTAQRRAVILIQGDQRTGNTELHRTGLPRRPASFDADTGIIPAQRIGDLERMEDLLAMELEREVLLEGTLIDQNFSGAVRKLNSCHGVLPSSDFHLRLHSFFLPSWNPYNAICSGF